MRRKGNCLQEDVCAIDGDSSPTHDVPWKHSTITRIVFDSDEDYDQDAKADESAYNIGVTPCFGRAAPLQCQNVADDGAQDDKSSEGIHLE